MTNRRTKTWKIKPTVCCSWIYHKKNLLRKISWFCATKDTRLSFVTIFNNTDVLWGVRSCPPSTFPVCKVACVARFEVGILFFFNFNFSSIWPKLFLQETLVGPASVITVMHLVPPAPPLYVLIPLWRCVKHPAHIHLHLTHLFPPLSFLLFRTRRRAGVAAAHTCKLSVHCAGKTRTHAGGNRLLSHLFVVCR